MANFKSLILSYGKGVTLPKNPVTQKGVDIGQVLYYNEDAGIDNVVQLPNHATMYDFDAETGVVKLEVIDGVNKPVVKKDSKTKLPQLVKSRFSIVTKDTGDSYLFVSVHLEAGPEAEKDIIRHHQRLAIQREIDKIIAVYPELKKVVIYGDLNKSAFKPNPGMPGVAAIPDKVISKGKKVKITVPGKDAIPAVDAVNSQDPNLTYNDFIVDRETLTNTANDFAGENLVLEDYTVSERIIQKVRLFFNFFGNQQTKKGGKLDWDSKTGILVYSIDRTPLPLEADAKAAIKLARKNARDEVINTIKVPKGKITKLGTDQTGVDHGAARANVDGIRVVAQPLIKTSGNTGFMPWDAKFTRALTAKDLVNQEAASRTLVYLILKAKKKSEIYNILKAGKTDEQIEKIQQALSPDALNEMKEGEGFSDTDVKFIGYAGDIIDSLNKDEITALLKKWAVTNEYKAAIKPAKVNALASDESIAAIVAKIFSIDVVVKKGDNKKLEVITGDLDLQLSGGFAPMTTNPRTQQKKTIYSHLKNCDILGTTEDGPDNHDNYKYDTQKMLGQLKSRTYLNMALSFVGGAIVGTAAAVLLGAALPVVAAAAAASAVLATSTFYYTRGVSPAEVVDKKAAAEAEKANKKAEADAKKAAAKAEKALEKAKVEADAKKTKADADAKEAKADADAKEAKAKAKVESASEDSASEAPSPLASDAEDANPAKKSSPKKKESKKPADKTEEEARQEERDRRKAKAAKAKAKAEAEAAKAKAEAEAAKAKASESEEAVKPRRKKRGG